MPAEHPLIIIGAGHAGGRTALALRAQGYPGRISLLGEEAQAPYERPPLSKQLLLQQCAPAACQLLPAEEYAAREIDLRTGQRVRAIRPSQHRIELADGSTLPYSRLVLATGGRPRLPTVAGSQLSGIHTLRNLTDALALRDRLRPASRLVVIGGGFIGLEVAASARQLGCAVSVVESAERLASRALPPALSLQLERVHQAHGVEILLSSQVQAFIGHDTVQAVQLADGRQLPCNLVLIGIGIQPNVELAAAAGLQTGNGIRVDAQLRSSDPDIYAIGDVCEFISPYSREWTRQETWSNAESQAAHLANVLCGASGDFAALPSFWSDQFDCSLHVLGQHQGCAHCVQRQVAADSLLLFFLDAQQRLRAVCAWGKGNTLAKDVKLAGRLIQAGVPLDVTALATPACSLKTLLQGVQHV